MAEEIDETGFYREDFSTESDWEVLIFKLGEVFQRWELSAADWGRDLEQDELFYCPWKVQTETIELLKKEITVSFYIAQLKTKAQERSNCRASAPEQQSPFHNDLMSVRNSFGPPLDARVDLHPLARLYGLRRFVVMHPSQLQTQFLTNPAEFSFFLSAASVVAVEVCSTVPIFVQIYDPKWNYFVGVGVAPTLRTNFDLVAMEQGPADCRYLSGLLTMFKEKLPTTYLRPATVSVRNTYALDTVKLRIPMRVPFANTLNEIDDAITLSTSQFIALPNGYFPDSCTERYAIYTWPEIAENIAIDSALRSDFVPSKAPFGSIEQSVRANSYLSSCLRDYDKLYGASQSLESFVGRNFSGTSSTAEVANPLDQLTQPHMRHLRSHRNSRKHMLSMQSQLKKLPGPMNENELNQMLYYLFPEMHPEIALFPYSKKAFKDKFDPHRIKSACPDSLVCRLSCLLATCNAHFGGKSGMAQLWAAFTRELRVLWDCCLTIPGIAAGFPDARTCLLHQKLQMLNICKERRELREFGDKADAPKQTLYATTSDEDDDNDDEFYDCTNYEDDTTATGEATSKVNRPEGRQKRLGDMKLLDTDEPLYIPMTQEPVPKTEDQLHNDAEVMLKLGPGSGLTTQMMCSALLSDMEAFKAANPKAKMEDFIRWYSPKDWEESTNDNGTIESKLSKRMLAPDNTWQTVWKQAMPVPAWRQKRLFDDTNEALKVLHYLETRTIGEIYELTIVPMLHSAILKLKDIFNSAKVYDIFSAQFDIILADLCHLSRDIEIVGQTEICAVTQAPNPEPIIKKIEALEKQFYQYKCFERTSGYPICTKLNDLKQQFKEILDNGGSCKIIRKIESESEGDMGMLNPDFKNEMRDSLISKDYVIRLEGETTSLAKGKMGPQFLRAIVTGEKIRLCCAFTENTTFI